MTIFVILLTVAGFALAQDKDPGDAPELLGGPVLEPGAGADASPPRENEESVSEKACARMLGNCVPISPFVRALPLFDAHNHLQHDQPAELLIRWMDENNVRRMVLVPRHFSPDGLATDEQALQYVKRYPERFVATIGGQRDDLYLSRHWNSYNASGFLGAATSKLRSREYAGLGEFIIRHYGYNKYVSTTHQSDSGEQDIALRNQLMERIFDLAREFGVPVLIHAEAEPRVREHMRRLLDDNPQVRVVWAHNCGRGPAENAAEFLGRHPQLMCDLAGMAVPYPSPFGWGMFGTDAGSAERRPGTHVTRVQNNDGSLNPSMRELFERFPERFMIGTDIAHPPHYYRYGDVVIAFRRMLSQLNPETAKKIAYDNAARFYPPRP